MRDVNGLLGPNGAGKTTTLRMLLNLVMPTAGTATIGGRRYVDIEQPDRVVGAVLEASSAHKGRTGRNHLKACCITAGLPLSRAEEVLDLVGLMPAADRRFKGYSLGMKQRLGIAAAMLGDPRVLILDEPANGLDPEGIRWIREFLQGLATEGRTVLVSSHLLSEMQALADDVVIVAAGRLVRQGAVREVLASMAGDVHIQVGTPDPGKLASALRAIGAEVRPAGPDTPRLIHAEIFKLRTTSMGWLFAVATVLSTAVMLVVNAVNANSLLKPFAQYVSLETHGHGDQIPPDFLSHLQSDWQLGHSAITQATTLYTSGQLIGVLLACLLGIVLITSEYHQQTATTTFLQTPRRTRVVAGKLGTAVVMAAASWLVSTVISVVAGAIFLHHLGYGTELGHWGVLRAILLNLAAYAIWGVCGVGFGALIRSQLGATVAATVLYLVGASAAGSVFDLIHTYLINKDWVLTLQVIVPEVASAMMISPTRTFTQSPAEWVGAAVLIAYGIVAGLVGTSILRRRDIA